MLNILIVEDDPGIAKEIKELVEEVFAVNDMDKNRYRIKTEKSYSGAVKICKELIPDLAIVDHQLAVESKDDNENNRTGFDVAEMLFEINPNVYVLVNTQHAVEDIKGKPAWHRYVEEFKAKHDERFEFFEKSPEQILDPKKDRESPIKRPLNVFIKRLLGEISPIEKDLNEKLKAKATQSKEFTKQLSLLIRRRKKGVLVLRGESGSGKTKTADIIHEIRRKHNLIDSSSDYIKPSLNQTSSNLNSSELFGHVKGAFTGAVESKPGAIEKSNHGTVFIDEIADLNLKTQSILKTFLDKGEFSRIGSQEKKISEAFIIFATWKDIDQLIAEGKIQEDFWYRIKGYQCTIPSITERHEDISPIAKGCLAALNETNATEISFSPAANDFLLSEISPIWSETGGVRVLNDLVTRAFDNAYNQESSNITPSHLAKATLDISSNGQTGGSLTPQPAPTYKKQIKDKERHDLFCEDLFLCEEILRKDLLKDDASKEFYKRCKHLKNKSETPPEGTARQAIPQFLRKKRTIDTLMEVSQQQAENKWPKTMEWYKKNSEHDRTPEWYK